MFIGMIYELLIIIIASIILSFVMKKYLEKKHKLTFYLFLMFLNFVIAIIFSWLSKVLRLYSGINYVVDPLAPDPMTLESWFFLRIISLRFTMIFIIIAILYNYILKINLFERNLSGIGKKYDYIIYGYTVFSIFYMLIIYIKGNNLLDMFALIITLIYICLVLVPFMRNCLQAYKAVDNQSFKTGFLSLFLMSISIILIFIFQILDRVMIILYNIIGYTIFYFLGWSFAIIAIIFSYYGYIKPKNKDE